MTRTSIENDFNEEKVKYLKNLNEIEEKVINFQQLYLQSYETTAKQSLPVPINLEIETIKELISDEENRIKSLNLPSATPSAILNLKSLSNNIYDNSNINYNEKNLSSYYASKKTL
jgi:hypothetical protein